MGAANVGQGGLMLVDIGPFFCRRQRELCVVEAPAGLADDALEIHYAILQFVEVE